MQTPSEEQQIIIDHITNGKNVIVNAVAGSGKSTTIISLARQLSEKTIFQITYNSMLRHEMKEKIQNLELSNLTIHTFHSLAVKYYLDSAHTDTELRHILYHDIKPRISIPIIDILTIDEAQDMSLLYFHFIFKFIRDIENSEQMQLMVLGDHQQSLYEFKGADARFLTMAHKIWSKVPIFCDRPFELCTLRTSYRITNPMANFVNQTMLGNDRMIAPRSGEPVTYIRNSRYNIEKTVLYHIQQLLQSGIKPSDIFILSGSIKGINSHVRKLENILVENNIPCHIPTLDQDKLDERVINGKIVFSTFHTVKGRQRRFVFVVGFDHSYFQTVAFSLNPKECPNTLYVGCTRATDGLFLLEFDNYATDRPLEFLKMNHHEMNACDFIKFKGLPQIQFYVPSEKSQDPTKQDKRYLTPTKLIKFIPDHVMDEIAPIMEKIFIQKQLYGNSQMDIPNIIQTEYGFEDVSDLNGISIPAMYYDEIQKKWQPDESKRQNVLYTMIEEAISEMRENEHYYLKNIVKNLPKTCETINEYLFLANIYISIQERLYFKLKQIKQTEYNWLTPTIIEQCRKSLDDAIGQECELGEVFTEERIIHHSEEELHNKIDNFLENHLINTPLEKLKFRFTAIVDLITKQSIWEIKCTSKITIDHQLQLVIYAWIWMVAGEPTVPIGESKQFRIFNIKTGEIWEMNATLDDLTFIMLSLLKGKYMKPQEKTDEEFILDIDKIINL
jgi:AAA domain